MLRQKPTSLVRNELRARKPGKGHRRVWAFSVLLQALVPLSYIYAAPPAPLPQDIPGQSEASKDVHILDIWMEPIGNDGKKAAIYFTLENTGEHSHLLTMISSPACQDISGYHSDQEETETTEELFTHLALPEGATLVFPPGGYYAICEGVSASLSPGEKAKIMFSFLGGDKKTVEATMYLPGQFKLPSALK